jgi:DNA-directed RNA polymerase subunit L
MSQFDITKVTPATAIPKVTRLKNRDGNDGPRQKPDRTDVLRVTLSNANVSVANAIRRTILSDIETVVFRTSPFEMNQSVVTANTTRLNNELIGQRLSCIPIHLQPILEEINHLQLELKEENRTDTIMLVTSEHFQVFDTKTEKYLSKSEVQEIFPPNPITGDYIEFIRLRPKLADGIPGEKIELTCKFSIWTSATDASFNVTSLCSYGCTHNPVNAEIAFENKKRELQADPSLEPDEVDFKLRNWRILDAQRVVIPNSFDFAIESIGVFENVDIFKKACNILIARLQIIKKSVDEGKLLVTASTSTMENSFDLTFQNESHTIGKLLEYMIHAKYYEGEEKLTFCGFQQAHPHDSFCSIRMAFKDEPTQNTIFQIVTDIIDHIIIIYDTIIKDMDNLDNL